MAISSDKYIQLAKENLLRDSGTAFLQCNENGEILSFDAAIVDIFNLENSFEGKNIGGKKLHDLIQPISSENEIPLTGMPQRSFLNKNILIYTCTGELKRLRVSFKFITRDNETTGLYLFQEEEELSDKYSSALYLSTFHLKNLENAPVLILILNKDGKIVHYNKTFEKTTQRSLQETQDLDYFDLFIPESNREVIREKFRNSIKSGKSNNIIYEILDAGRNHRTIDWRDEILFDDQKNNIGMTSIGLDITEDSSAVKKLSKYEKRLKDLFENTTIGIYTSTPSGQVILANPVIIDLLGYDNLEDVSKNFSILQGFQNKRAENSFFETLKAEGKIDNYETIWTDRYGNKIHIRQSVRAIKDQQNCIKHIEGFVVNITDKIEVEKELQRSQRTYQKLIENLNEGVWVLDNQGKTTYVNPKIENLIGLGKESLSGTAFIDFFNFERHRDEETVKLISSDLKKNIVCKLINYAGKAHEVILNLIPLEGSDSENEGYLATITDVENLINAENRIKMQLKEKDILLKEVHHRVKNNFQIISSLLSLQTDQIDNPIAREALLESKNRIRVIATVHESLYQSKNISQIDFKKYIDRLMKSLLYSFGKDFEQVHFEIIIDDIFLSVNKAIPCAMIINELVSNSLKHAFPNRAKGFIRVEMNADSEGNYKMIIADNGIGIKNFWNFLDEQTLGMRLVIDFVKQLNGIIELDCDEQVRYTVRFPCS